jgi:hypothetical protein
MRLGNAVLSFEWNFSDTTNRRTMAMAWNYRVIYQPKGEEITWDSDTFSIREVFYNDLGEIEHWSDEDATPYGTTFEELAADFDLMQEAFERPILMVIETEEGLEGLIELEDEEGEEEEI